LSGKSTNVLVRPLIAFIFAAAPSLLGYLDKTLENDGQYFIAPRGFISVGRTSRTHVHVPPSLVLRAALEDGLPVCLL
jgi:hypothetical protein